MKLLIVSDTHGNYQDVVDIIEREKRFDSVIHLGDEVEDAFLVETITGCRVTSIAGNCDRASSVPRELLTVLGGVTFLITHGDAYHVKGGLSRLREKAAREKVGAVLYGHTHAAAIDLIDGIHYINPGSLSIESGTRTYAVITLGREIIRTDIVAVSPPPSGAGQQPHPQL